MIDKTGIKNTPAYFFDKDEFATRVKMVSDGLAGIPLTYSIKANPFLLYDLPNEIAHVEVCSPGELDICKTYGIPGGRIIYSGVNKEFSDVSAAVLYGSDIVTCESRLHLDLVEKACEKNGIGQQKVILRFTSGNQFGMSRDSIFSIFDDYKAGKYPCVNIFGIHYYSGTQKKIKQISKDLEKLSSLLENLKDKYEYEPTMIEYGPGLSVYYFDDDKEDKERAQLREFLETLKEFKYYSSLGIELGRFLAAPCGYYATRVMDIKCNDEVNYVICDGGIHQIRYYGQTLAMQVPPIEVISGADSPVHTDEVSSEKYCFCGSLCTVADVMIREVELPKLKIGDIILFGHCGAYSLYEGNSLFLSRELPEINIYSKDDGIRKIRECIEISKFYQR